MVAVNSHMEKRVMHRHVKIFAVACIVVAIAFVAGRYVMITNVAHYDGDHP